MKFDLPSFLLGSGAAASAVLFGKRLRPVLLDLATLLYRATDSVLARTPMKQEHLEELLFNARARARQLTGGSTARAQAQA
ncbi:hypothetical protein JQX13_22315 [Archangium violaceum]|uniref:hypothetical protein n=1 Tax=Archangium violaceum TaxID=83451 RepID=UPI00193AE568|nr:hypothetical protein [Archangium violaceum]QRK12517.1 hypothetical protein JQX13_22315 [Archangium violaceum]